MLDGSQPAATIDAVMAKPVTVDGQRIRQIVEKLERLIAVKQDALDEIKEAFSDAKSEGYLTTPLRKIIAERKRDPNDLSEEDAVMEMYRSALGM
jgi:uncharacterized protein (UPF0335 family)